MPTSEARLLPTDEQLIRQVFAGDRGAYADLVRRYERHVHAVAWAILRDHHAAQDAAQDTFIKAYGQLATLRSHRSFGAWLLTLARSTAADRARGKKRLVFVSDVPDAPTTDLPADDAAAIVVAAVNHLPPHEQQVILFRYFDGLPVAEIAALMGCPVGTVTKQLSRALARLREQFKETP
jgi:RNA polymerase sigma-70 factor (ECF subfamily)